MKSVEKFATTAKKVSRPDNEKVFKWEEVCSAQNEELMRVFAVKTKNSYFRIRKCVA